MNQQSSSRRLLVGLAFGAIVGGAIGLILGLLIAYQIAPVQWTNAGPQDLRVDYAAYYWELVAESYAEHGDLEKARTQLGEWSDEKVEAALERAAIESSPEVQMYLDSLKTKAGFAGAAAEPALPQETPAAEEEPLDEAGLGSMLARIAVFFLVILVLVVAVLLILRMRKRSSAAAPVEQIAEEPPEWLATLHPEESEPALPALGHFVTGYALGDDTYDESFSIETSAGEFLGECGVGISETIGEGEPDRVTAFEVWLFDKNDIRTVTQVLMSEHAYNDPDIRASLAPKGEAVLARVNEPLVLETATLRLDVLVTEMVYGSGALPPNSFFDRLTVELVARGKEGAEAQETQVI
ncbi:MAG: hypothetical protein JXA09_14840 [Anaerolineae bacterium]|nr:hypothetical protein [Anaerolineae bacterium]